MFSPGVTVQLLILTFIAFTVSGVQKLTVTPDRGTSLNISNSQAKGCKVCTGAGRSRTCNQSLVIRQSTSVTLEFECSRPQDVFSVEIVRNIECTTKLCNGHIIQADSNSLPLLDFNRKFIWNLKASAPEAFKIDFNNLGMRQINPSERCPDGHSYTLQAFQTTGNVAVGKYCRTGPVVSAQILNQGSFSLDVPAGQKLQKGQFDVSVGEEIKSLAKITLMVPNVTWSSELLSPNYPDSFPDDDLMQWDFRVPDKHKTAIQFLNLTQPRCLKKETAAEYHNTGRVVIVRKVAMVRSLTEPQPDHIQGNFTLTLRNCEMDRRRVGSPGLSLNIKVSSSASCKVDMSQMEGLSLHIEKLRPASDCLMKINSVPKDKITATSRSELTFQDCTPEDVQVTATRVIECSQLKDCPKRPFRLSVPAPPSCLPTPLSSVTWTLRPPQHGTVELSSPTEYLKQSLPGQKCNGSVVIEVAEDDGATIGHFCHQGAIQKVQIQSNVSVTVSGVEGKALGTPVNHVLHAIFTEEISENYIFTVAPKKDTPVLLATPSWPAGMKPSSTVSWIVAVPPKMDARLMFANLSQPKCKKRHTNIKVQRVGCSEEEYSRREDEEAEREFTVSANFYLNMSNCIPERGDFRVITKITLQKSKNLLLTIILSVVAALLVIFVIMLVVVCVVIRKKKKKLNHQVSIYNPNGTSFLPGHSGFPKTREDNESHVYASIEETLVYTDLLRKGAEMGVYGEFDTYRPFKGHTESQKPLVCRDTDSEDIPVGTYQQFQAPPLPVRPPSHAQSLVENVIYQSDGEEGHSSNLGQRLEPEGGN
ncbi:CUB domain-containing protein 1-like [Anoplopoma fimbria]|uniref:CUB domain-containing protein 1-like n=1 Tax=Anoplopoma fimbria TaxID=229290 RepID=UPI0023ECE41F|nr:CUB domain-containing protein 1-like [Anoplopoma fimbria]